MKSGILRSHLRHDKTLPQDKLDQLAAYIESLPTKIGVLIDVLYKAQEIFGYIPQEAQLFIARRLELSGAEVSGVVSFYSNFTTTPQGKHVICVCMGTACFVRGAEKLLNRVKEKLGVDVGETTEDQLFSLKELRCVGACGLAPVVMFDDKVYGRVTEADLDRIIGEYQTKEGGRE